MPRGNVNQTKVVYSGEKDTYVVFAENKEIVEEWRGDRSIPLAQVVAGFKVFITHGHGAQNVGDTASHLELENEFGTKNEDDVIIKILEKGDIQVAEHPERQGTKNVSQGPMGGH